MQNEKRKNPRRHVEYPAQIELGDGSTRPCLLFDASDAGARLVVKAPDEIPDQFTLTFGHDGGMRRHCRVAWRNDNTFGLQFVKEAPKKHAAGLPGRAFYAG